jgi:hypothetical protein
LKDISQYFSAKHASEPESILSYTRFILQTLQKDHHLKTIRNFHGSSSHVTIQAQLDQLLRRICEFKEDISSSTT